MLEFFRKHQKYFFAVITFMVVISFSFFGTYDTLQGNNIHEQIAFKAIDGSNITRGELDSLLTFISTDSSDKKLFGGNWGPNFLNDGVVKNDILATGLADVLVTAYPDQMRADLDARLEKEKRYTLYAHPQAAFLSTEAAWEYFAPSMKKDLKVLKLSKNPASKEAFNARVALFLNERQFPPQLLKQVLSYQQKQYNWINPDPNLNQVDLSLFGYHTLDDWFGNNFLRIVSEFIINGSKIAEQKGYVVTKEEALADLMRNAEVSYQQNLNNPYLGVANSSEYFREQLRLLSMDQTRAVKVWQQVLLFRRLFQDVGNAALVDNLTHNQFVGFTKEKVTGDLYKLPPELRFADYRTLQQFEIYLYAVAKRARLDKMNDKEMLSLPTAFLSADEVKKKYPELVQKKYVLEVAQANKNSLLSKATLKDVWNWEVQDKNWNNLKKEFPELGLKSDKNREERNLALDNLDDKTRARVDAFARNAMVDSNPEWIDEALNQAKPQPMTVGVRSTGGAFFIVGLEDREELIGLLDQAELNANPQGKLKKFTANNSNFYRIKVIERIPGEEVLTFGEAKREKVLDQLLDQILEAHYLKVREGNATAYQKEDKSWKNYAEVRDVVADNYYEKLLKAIQVDAKEEKVLTGDRSASLRFNAYMKDVQDKLKQNDNEATSYLKNNNAKTTIADQWKLEKSSYNADRSTVAEGINADELFHAPVNGWTAVNSPVNGDISFFQLKERNSSTDVTASYDKLHAAHRLASNDAQRTYMRKVVSLLKENNAISIDYLNVGEDNIQDDVAGN